MGALCERSQSPWGAVCRLARRRKSFWLCYTLHCSFSSLLLTNRVTREHRESLAKLAKQSTNKSKEALRKVRSKSINQVKKFKSKVSEDTIWLLEKQVSFFLAVYGSCWLSSMKKKIFPTCDRTPALRSEVTPG